MTPDHVWAVYCALWARSERDEVPVYYEGARAWSGGFDPHDRNGEPTPAIRIVRPSYRESPLPNRIGADGKRRLRASVILAEVCTLAHERGHSIEWQRYRTPAYLAALAHMHSWREKTSDVPLSDIEWNLVRTEEARAWDGGEAELRELGFNDWKTFGAKRRDGEKAYEAIFAGRTG